MPIKNRYLITDEEVLAGCSRNITGVFENQLYVNSMKLVIPLDSFYWSIHTKDESKCGTAFAFIFGVN